MSVTFSEFDSRPEKITSHSQGYKHGHRDGAILGYRLGFQAGLIKVSLDSLFTDDEKLFQGARSVRLARFPFRFPFRGPHGPRPRKFFRGPIVRPGVAAKTA